MRYLLAFLLFVATLAHADTITLIGPVAGMGGTEDYYKVPNTASLPLNIVKRPDGYRNLVLGGLTCSNGLALGSDTLTCTDGTTATLELHETYSRVCRAGRCNAHWTLVSGTVERP